MRKLFKEAEEEEAAKGDESQLHVIIFDEIDSICKVRSLCVSFVCVPHVYASVFRSSRMF